MLVFIPVFNILFKVIDPQMKTYTPVRRVLIGFFVTSLASGVMMYAAHLTQGGTVLVTAWWMVLAYIILTAGEVLLYGTMLDLSYAAAPKSMKGFITACFLLTNTMGIDCQRDPAMNYQPQLYFLQKFWLVIATLTRHDGRLQVTT